MTPTEFSSPYTMGWNDAMQEAASVTCGGCRAHYPLTFGRHQTRTPGQSGSLPCIAEKILALKVNPT